MSRERITLPVLEIRKYPKKWYYVVEYGGRQYQVPLMPFQREAATHPQRIQCIIERSSATQGIFLKQDFAPLLASRYKEGQLYDFTIEDDYTNTSTPHYKIADGSGFWFKLYSRRNDGFRPGDRVRCRVTRLSGVNMSLEAVARIGEVANEPLSADIIRKAVGDDVIETLRLFVGDNPAVAQALDEMNNGDYRWIFHAIEAAWNVILERGRSDTARMREAITALERIVIYLLEDTQYLNTLDAAARTDAQGRLSLTAARSEDLLSAIDIVEQNREQEYITDILCKMEASGYLFRPERKLRMLMYIFALRKESMDSNMQKLLGIIHRGRQDNWSAEPFRSAFVGQLELYIDSNHAGIDSLSTLDTPADSESLEKMLQALAIQQLLLRDNDESVNQVINRSRLYRYFTFISRFEQDRLLDKALATVTSRTVDTDEFRWTDTSRVDTMSARLLAPLVSDNTSTMCYEASGVTLSVDAGGITLSSGSDQAVRPALPSSLNLWQNINVCLDDQLPAQLRQPQTVRDYKRVWAEIERAFFEPDGEQEAVVADTRRTPDVGDEVTVVVDGIDPDNPLRLHCTLVDDTFAGHGWIVMKEVTNMDRQAPLMSFRNAEGRPYLLKAEVRSIDDGELDLSMRPAIGRMLCELIAPDDEVDCVITYCDERAHRYIAFSENGYSLFVDPGDFRGQMRRGLNIRARVTFVRSDGLAVNGRCIAANGMPISYPDAVQVLMANFSDEKVYDRSVEKLYGNPEDAVARSADEMLTSDEMNEIMLITGRKGDVEDDLVKRFNYHSFARLMAMMLGNEAQAEYYRQRCAVIEILDDFATNGQVDPERLERVSREHSGILTSTSDGRKLLTLSMLDRPECNDKLWNVCNEADNDKLGRLGRLVLAYNLLDGYKMGDERGRIRSEIYTLLNLRRDVQPMQIEQGHESQTVEFKTSSIYQPGPRLRRAVREQTAEIVEKITGMLNADGGRIYVGVSDEGYIRGLAPDMEFFGTRDRFELNMRNSITEHCGFIPNGNSHIVTSWQTFGEKEVYVIDLTPLSEPVAFDGVYYQRQGTSNRFVPANQVDAFLAARRGKSVAEPVRKSAPAVRSVPSSSAGPVTAATDVAATTASRPNVLHDGYDGFRPVSAYLYFGKDDTLTVSDTDQWLEDESTLALALTEDELDGELLMIYRSGGVAVSPMRFAVKNFEKEPRRLRKNDPIVFAAPLASGQGLILYSRDGGGNVVKQAFRSESLPRVGMLKGQGEHLMKDMTPVWAEIIDADRLVMFGGITRNGQKVKGDYRADIKANTEPRLGFSVNIP